MEYLKKLKSNPVNPRKISKENLNKLKKSILTFPEMLEKRPIVYDEDGIILGGNMRFQAIKELVNENKFEIKDSYFVSASGWSIEKKREFVIRDNIELGDWEEEILVSDWKDLPLDDWGIDIELEEWYSNEDFIEVEDEKKPSIKITLKDCKEQDLIVQELEDLKVKYNIEFSISC